MRIETISADNFSLRTLSHQLAPLTIITGNNASGKSTIKDAILLAATGKHPDAPASNAGIMDTFGTGPSMTVAITAANRTLSRTWSRNGKTVKAIVLGDEALGSSLAPAFFAGRAFLAAKPAERANMLRAAYPSAHDPKEAVLEAISEAKGIRLALADSLSFDGWVESYVDAMKEEAKAHRANIKRMKGVIQGLEQLTSDELVAPVTKEALEHAREKVSKLSIALGIQNNKISNAIDNRTALPEKPDASRETLEQRIAEHTKNLADITKEIHTLEADNKIAADRRNQALQAYRTKLDAHNAAVAGYERALREAEKLGLKEETTAEEIHDILSGGTTEDHAAARRELRAKIDESAAIFAASQTAVGVALAKVEAVDIQPESDTCQTCGSHRKHWDGEILNAVRDLIRTRKEQHAEAVANSQAAHQSLSMLQAQSARMEAEADKLVAGAYLLEAARLALANQKPDAPAEPAPQIDLEEKQADAYQHECAIQDAKEMLADLATIAEHEENEATIATLLEGLRTSEKDLARETETLTALAAAWEAQNGKRENEAKIEQASKELAEAEASLVIAEATAEIVAESAKAEALKVLEPLLKTASMFTDGILTPPITNAGLAIGRWHDATWQPINRLSGAEQAMVTAALGAALATGEASKIVIIDEFSVIDDAWKPLFLANLRKAQEAGLIEQAIILDNRKTDAEGWTTIEVSA